MSKLQTGVLVLLAVLLSAWAVWQMGSRTSTENSAVADTAHHATAVAHRARTASSRALASSAAAMQEKNVFSCMIEPEQVVEIRSSVTGVIESIAVARGDVVKKGQVLVKLNAAMAESSVAAARYRAQSSAQIVGARQKLHAARVKAQRMQAMYAQEFVSAQARDDALSEQRAAQAELKHALEMRQIAHADYRTSMADLELRTIRSPLDGVVSARYMDAGSVVSSAENKNPILKLAQIDRLKLTAILPFKYFQNIQNGDAVSVIPEAPFSTPVRAIITKKDKVIDAASGTFSITAYLDNHDHKLPGGILCQLAIKDGE